MSTSRVSRAASSGTASDPVELPIVDCSECGIPVLRLKSKQPATFGQIFYKCPNNVKNDSTSCGFYKWENEYKSFVQRKLMKLGAGGRGVGHRSEWSQELDTMEMRQDMNRMKQDIMELKQQMRGAQLVCVACVACMFGVLIAIMCKAN